MAHRHLRYQFLDHIHPLALYYHRYTKDLYLQYQWCSVPELVFHLKNVSKGHYTGMNLRDSHFVLR